MESSHNILIRFRSKHIQLEQVHYELSTDLSLLQANLTAMREKKGLQYHWIPDLYQRLGLQLYEGVQEALERYGTARDKALEEIKQEKQMKRRIQLKVARKIEGENRKQWSKQHGDHMYGPRRRAKRKQKEKDTRKACKKSCECGSSTHSRTSHRDCPLNKHNETEEGACRSVK